MTAEELVEIVERHVEAHGITGAFSTGSALFASLEKNIMKPTTAEATNYGHHIFFSSVIIVKKSAT